MTWLDEWPLDTSVAMESLVDFFVLVQVVALVLMVLLLALDGPWFHWRGRRRRSFWCSPAQRPVEVEFEEQGVDRLRAPVPGRRLPAAVGAGPAGLRPGHVVMTARPGPSLPNDRRLPDLSRPALKRS